MKTLRVETYHVWFDDRSYTATTASLARVMRLAERLVNSGQATVKFDFYGWVVEPKERNDMDIMTLADAVV